MTTTQNNDSQKPKRTLTVDGNQVSASYLVSLLKHLSEFGTARTHSLAYALFPARTQTAAIAAIQRSLANAVSLGYVQFGAVEKTQHRFYALTKKGAAFLTDAQPELGPVSATTHLLKSMKKAEHREWTTMLTVWARLHNGLEAMNETALLGTPGKELNARFNHKPDGLTFDTTEPERPVVFWHEVELSRRSQWTNAQFEKKRKATDKEKKPTAFCGRRLFIKLLKEIWQLQYVEHDGKQYDVQLVLHCAGNQIKSSLKRWVRETLADDFYNQRYDLNEYENYFTATFGNKKHHRRFTIVFTDLPSDPGTVWHDSPVFPFPDAQNMFQRNDQADGEQFIKPAPRAIVQVVAPIAHTVEVPAPEVPKLPVEPPAAYHHGRHYLDLPEDGSEDEY